uniref:Uncharacterized protein n=1 Tax=Panagrolaimus sp. ES5 TaxID=591445 RepID=A0AC34GWM1_9BILA
MTSTFNNGLDVNPGRRVTVEGNLNVPILVRCKPPFCNPFVHNTAFGVDVEPGDDVLFDGGLDFPLPLAPSGVGVRIPVSGGVSVGTDPLLITYGHGMGPVEPPNFKSAAEKKEDREERRLIPSEKNVVNRQ